MKIEEKLDFSFSTEDYASIDDIFSSYLQDRKNTYENLFKDQSYSKEESLDYINFFIIKLDNNEEQHPYLDHIKHFLNRKYEFFTLPEIEKIVDQLKKWLSPELDTYSLEDEEDTLDSLHNYWVLLGKKIRAYPLLTLSNYNKIRIGNTALFYKEDTDDFVLDSVHKYVSHIVDLFPEQLARLDCFILCSPEYISFSGGKNTFAYYLEDSVFLKNSISEEDKKFYIETLYHEFGHFLFELMKERNQIRWYNLYDLWESKGVTMSRDEGKNDPEELFADAFSILMTNVHDYLNPNLNPIILQYCKIFLKDEFKVVF